MNNTIQIDQRSAASKIKAEISKHGSLLVREYFPYSGLNDLFIRSFMGEGEWTRVGGNQCYFAYSNRNGLTIVSYCEGDVVTTKAPDEETFNRELLDYTADFLDL